MKNCEETSTNPPLEKYQESTNNIIHIYQYHVDNIISLIWNHGGVMVLKKQKSAQNLREMESNYYLFKWYMFQTYFKLGGGCTYFLSSSLYLGKWNPIWFSHILKWPGLVQPSATNWFSKTPWKK